MRNILVFIVCFLTSLSFAQERATVKGNIAERQNRKAAATRQINALRNGVLLVRLDFESRKIAYYKKYNNLDEVNRIQEKQEKINFNIRDAFNTYFDFCPVYYFGEYDSEALADGKLDEVEFFNGQGEPADRSFLSDTSKLLFIGEFGYIEQDTLEYYSGSTPSTNSETNPEGKTYYGGSKTNKPALVIRDVKFRQLQDPFPFYTGYSFFGLVSKRYRVPVKKMNEKLTNFLKKKGDQE